MSSAPTSDGMGIKGWSMETEHPCQGLDDDSIPVAFPFNEEPDVALLGNCHSASGVMAALDR